MEVPHYLGEKRVGRRRGRGKEKEEGGKKRKRRGRRINLGSIWREILSLPARMFLCGCLTIYQLVYVSHFWVALDYQLYSNTCSVVFSSFLC